MGRAPCCDKANVKRGPWSPEEDSTLKNYIERYGTGGNWIALPQKVGLKRCGKSCRLRWLNYLRPNIKHGEFSDEEDRIIFNLFITIGSRWSIIAAQLPGRTDNDIKNYWNTKLKKKLMGLLPNPLINPQPPPPPPRLLLPPSFHIHQQAQPQAVISPYYHSYINNYPSTSDNSSSSTTATTSSVATIDSVLHSSCYEPFSMKDQEFPYFVSDPSSCISPGNQQMTLGAMMKPEEGFEFEFEFEFEERINQWAEKMSEYCFGTELDLIARDPNPNPNRHHNHHGMKMNQLGSEVMGLYY